MIAIVILTLIISPMLVTPAHRLAHLAQKIRPAPWIRRSSLRESRDRTRGQNEAESSNGELVPAPLALIAGFGPVGRDVAEKLRTMGWRISIIELNPSTVHRQTELGRSIMYGDVTNPEVLHAAGVGEAAAFIITIPDHDSADRGDAHGASTQRIALHRGAGTVFVLRHSPTQTAIDNLQAEGFNQFGNQIVLSGGIMYDAALFYKSKADENSIILHELGLKKNNYILATIHRQENTDDKERLTNIILALNEDQ